ncbi:sigma-54-dependent transcriptional regulator [Scleromatobacter humisilvae]|uniref:Sigma-54 dependent transcriptional regulator n=1 Tax=Scleromatobacter humisilvae TaxID=2897159 RepID=A0A9X1YN10_9BURK|nr:sigma-54 dependent transcriptional regulator [Scleromatobacter humisilvae]MCK9688470.1 sigma-54 dependent transcriptional regulator [Scleromatobacter humisilvae]
MTATASATPTGTSAVQASSVLVVDDEPDLLTLYELTLLREGLEVETASSVAQAREVLQSRVFRAVISDMRLPDGTGLDLLQWLEKSGRPEKVIVVTAYGSPENAVTALKAGAFDYLTKPVDLRQFRAVVASAMGRSRATPPPAADAAPADGRGDPLRRLVGNSEAMAQVRSLVEKVARSMAPVLVQGESGTGKELVARAIHDVSARAGQPFVAVNCGAIPETLLESEFFGVRKGAFTGANADRDGFFQAANGGTLFLDEIGDLPFAMQSKLLRAIQERAVRAVGGTSEQTMNVRIVSATHKDLAAEVQAGRFRQDLFYRLNVIDIKVPPLRDRLVDLPAIADALLARLARDVGVTPARLTPDARALLARYAFPGNVRELENLLHRAVALSDGEAITGADLALPEALLAGASAVRDPEASAIAAVVVEDAAGPTVAEAMGAAPPAGPATPAAEEPVPDDLVRYLDEVERVILVRALERQNFNRTAAGASLGLSLRQMRYRMARLGITESESSDP